VTIKGSTTYTSSTIDKDTTDFAISANTCTGTITTSCTITVKFDPATPGAKKATLVVEDSDPTSPQLIGITGTGTSYESFSPASVTFATQIVNTASKATKIEFKYAGTGSITLNSLTPTASYSVNETGITTDACAPGTTVLSTDDFCYFNVVFTPTATGTTNGSVTASFSADPTGNTSLVLPLTGVGTGVSLSPTALAFGTVTSGTKNLSVTVTNKGSAVLTFSGTPTISGTGAAQFQVLPYSASPATSTCLNGTVSLSTGQSCTFTVQFSSTGNGDSYAATLTINDSDPASPQKVAMTGKE
jgi:trimeric autotransporter adhesin